MAKSRLQVTMRKDLKEWLDAQIRELRFADYSHAVEVAVFELKKKMEKEKKETYAIFHFSFTFAH